MNPFKSEKFFKDTFKNGLLDLSGNDGLGAFILLMANATFDSEIYPVLKETLRKKFTGLQERYRSQLENGVQLKEVDEDLLVFLKMNCIGFEKMNLTEFRQEGDWEFQFNHLRGFRPARISNEKVTSLQQDFNHNGFHFNKPFLEKEKMWQGEIHGNDISLFYNKYPFVQYHLLLIPDRDKGVPQFLSEAYHEMAWEIIQQAGTTMPGMGAGYNSRGGYCSVNHLHFQLYLRNTPFAVEQQKWQHNQGREPYPVACNTFDTAGSSWEYIQELHDNNFAYNLLYVPGKVYVLSRAMQGSYQHADWTSGFSWYELAGGMILPNRADFAALSSEQIQQEYALLKLN